MSGSEVAKMNRDVEVCPIPLRACKEKPSSELQRGATFRESVDDSAKDATVLTSRKCTEPRAGKGGGGVGGGASMWPPPPAVSPPHSMIRLASKWSSLGDTSEPDHRPQTRRNPGTGALVPEQVGIGVQKREEETKGKGRMGRTGREEKRKSSLLHTKPARGPQI